MYYFSKLKISGFEQYSDTIIFIPKIDFPHCKTYADHGTNAPGYYYINKNGKINLTYCDFDYHTCHDYFLDGFRENNITYALNGYNEDPIHVNCDFNETSGQC